LAEPSAAVSEASRAATQEVEDETEPGETSVSVDWFDLPMLAKLESMHLVTEWQFQKPTRLRTLMRSDDDLATWVRPVFRVPAPILTMISSATNQLGMIARRTLIG
jgi:hypothetical protein